MKLKLKEDQLRREEEEEERQQMMKAKRAAEKHKMQRMIDHFKKEADKRQLLQLIEETILAQYMDDIAQWDEVDYAYIEEYMGVEQRNLYYNRDRKQRMQEALALKQKIMQNFELKRQELLMKLEQAHRKFLESLEEESRNIFMHAQISHAFVFSYFRAVPGELQDLINSQHR